MWNRYNIQFLFLNEKQTNLMKNKCFVVIKFNKKKHDVLSL